MGGDPALAAVEVAAMAARRTLTEVADANAASGATDPDTGGANDPGPGGAAPALAAAGV